MIALAHIRGVKFALGNFWPADVCSISILRCSVWWRLLASLFQADRIILGSTTTVSCQRCPSSISGDDFHSQAAASRQGQGDVAPMGLVYPLIKKGFGYACGSIYGIEMSVWVFLSKDLARPSDLLKTSYAWFETEVFIFYIIQVREASCLEMFSENSWTDIACCDEVRSLHQFFELILVKRLRVWMR